MKKLISILLIFLTFSLLQFGKQKKPGIKPKIGLLTFSVNAFDEESKKINANMKAVKSVINRELEKSFLIEEKTSDVITYSDIELPEVTIDPVVEPETNKKLENLCKKGWDGLVFGHFHQEDKLIVVTRFYLSKKKYRNIKKDDRIISASEIEIPATNLEKKSLGSYTAKSIQELIKAVKAKRPGVFGLKKKTQPKKVKQPLQTKVQQKQEAAKATPTKKQTAIELDYGVAPLTARDVYQMIIDNGFYCEKVSGSSFHGEAYNTLKKIKGRAFPYKRTVTATTKNNRVNTRSKSRKKKTGEENIVLKWSPKPIDCSFQEAVKVVAKRNKNKFDKDKKWRIPTIMELFSIIVKGMKKNYFPKGFQLPKDKSLTFWTSTPLKKEGTSLDYDKANKAYFVIQLVFLSNKGQYSLRFDFQNIDQKDIENIYLLPVYSDKVYTYTPLQGFDTVNKKTVSTSGGKDKIPGFEDTPEPARDSDNKTVPATSSPKKETTLKSQETSKKSSAYDKIPGFDDVPKLSKTPSPKAQSPSPKNPRKLLPRKIKVSLIPLFREDMYNTLIEQELNDFNYDVKQFILKKLKMKVRADLYYDLVVDNKRTDDPGNRSLFEKLHQIFRSPPEIRRKFMAGRIINDIMRPNSIDIIVIVKHGIGYLAEGFEYLNPLIISLVDNKPSRERFPHTKRGRGRLKEYVLKKIKNILYKKFSR